MAHSFRTVQEILLPLTYGNIIMIKIEQLYAEILRASSYSKYFAYNI